MTEERSGVSASNVILGGLAVAGTFMAVKNASRLADYIPRALGRAAHDIGSAKPVATRNKKFINGKYVGKSRFNEPPNPITGMQNNAATTAAPSLGLIIGRGTRIQGSTGNKTLNFGNSGGYDTRTPFTRDLDTVTGYHERNMLQNIENMRGQPSRVGLISHPRRVT